MNYQLTYLSGLLASILIHLSLLLFGGILIKEDSKDLSEESDKIGNSTVFTEVILAASVELEVESNEEEIFVEEEPEEIIQPQEIQTDEVQPEEQKVEVPDDLAIEEKFVEPVKAEEKVVTPPVKEVPKKPVRFPPKKVTPRPEKKNKSQAQIARRPAALKKSDVVRIYKSYPITAKRKGLEGRVLVRIRINSLGKAEQVTVLRSSGHTVLDEAAVRDIKRSRFIRQAKTMTFYWTFILD
ncbi:MAG: TonB family protein [Verrucomicrobiota bacterium]